MKFLIYICDRIRHGQYPRLPGFSHSEKHGKFVWQGRELTLEEFNAASAVVFAPNYLRHDYHLCPLAIAPAVAAPTLRLDGQKIYSGETHVAGLFGEKKHLRVLAEHAELRSNIETWLANTPTDQPL